MSESTPPIAVLLAALVLPATGAAAERVRQAGNIGLGFGGTSFAGGVSGKYFVNEANAFQGLVGLREDGTVVVFQFDYLYNFEPIWADSRNTLGWYAGFGGQLAPLADDGSLAASGIIGLDFDIDIAPLDVYLEGRPTLTVNPVADVRPFVFGAGARYFF